MKFGIKKKMLCYRCVMLEAEDIRSRVALESTCYAVGSSRYEVACSRCESDIPRGEGMACVTYAKRGTFGDWEEEFLKKITETERGETGFNP